MTKYLLAFVAVVGMGTVGCSGSDCEDGAERTRAKLEECGIDIPESDANEENAEEAECTEAAGTAAQKAATCAEATACGDDFLVKYAECAAK